MSAGFHVHHDRLDELRLELGSGHLRIEDTGVAVPSAPDAGHLSDVMGAVLAHPVRAGGEYSTGLAITADEVADGHRGYRESDEAAAHSFRLL